MNSTVDVGPWGDTSVGLYALEASYCCISVVELLVLTTLWLVGLAGWEPCWVIAVSLIGHSMQLVPPESQPEIMGLTLSNGNVVPWARYVGWLSTCPVLLMFLVSMAQAAMRAGDQVAVKPVPLLIANQLMVLMAVSAAATDDIPTKWFFYVVSIFCCGFVLSAASICFTVLYRKLWINSAAALWGGRDYLPHVLLFLNTLSFICGWLLNFPIAVLLSPEALGWISADEAQVGFAVGDLLSKNMWCCVSVVLKHKYIKKFTKQESPGESRRSSISLSTLVRTAALATSRRGSATSLAGDSDDDSRPSSPSKTPPPTRMMQRRPTLCLDDFRAENSFALPTFAEEKTCPTGSFNTGSEGGNRSEETAPAPSPPPNPLLSNDRLQKSARRHEARLARASGGMGQRLASLKPNCAISRAPSLSRMSTRAGAGAPAGATLAKQENIGETAHVSDATDGKHWLAQAPAGASRKPSLGSSSRSDGVSTSSGISTDSSMPTGYDAPEGEPAHRSQPPAQALPTLPTLPTPSQPHQSLGGLGAAGEHATEMATFAAPTTYPFMAALRPPRAAPALAVDGAGAALQEAAPPATPADGPTTTFQHRGAPLHDGSYSFSHAQSFPSRPPDAPQSTVDAFSQNAQSFPPRPPEAPPEEVDLISSRLMALGFTYGRPGERRPTWPPLRSAPVQILPSGGVDPALPPTAPPPPTAAWSQPQE